MRRLRAALDAGLTRLSPRLAAHAKLWRRTSAVDRAPRRRRWTGYAGVDYREQEQLERIRGWDRYADLFGQLRRDPAINLGGATGPVRNPWFATPDAEVYAAMIGDLAPRAILEIGAGFSTRVARRAVETLGLACRITVVDPAPRADVSGLADEVVRERIEAIDPSHLPLDEGSIVFVDSSHVSVPGGDVPFVYGTLIPALPSGATVHAHDVFLPYDYPPRPRRSLYNEQYVLHALLSGSPRYRVLLATYLMSALHADELARVVPGTERGSGGSFWFRVEG